MSMLMPKGTAVWVIDNTTLTVEQIAECCDVHVLEVQAMADGDVGQGIIGCDPIQNGKLSKEEIERCSSDPSLKLKQLDSNNNFASDKTKGPKYIPLSRRGDKPNAVAWLVKNHPELKDSQISRLVGTTKSTIEKIRNRSHWNISNISAKHPILLKLCSQEDLEKEVLKSGGIIGNPTEDG